MAVSRYVAAYFIGYRTVTRLLAFHRPGEGQVRLRVDFTGGFGDGIGLLIVSADDRGRILRIDAGRD
jgi:hypothetical protein